ncbi:MAG: flavodoxin family protein [Candidatus Hodarchaeales archaeon]
MSIKILGVSGSPIPNSNTDRAVKGVLEFSGIESEFVKLSEIDVKPCQACKRCVNDNICKVVDDFPALANKIREAEALVIGAYCPYRMIDAYTKAFLERLWSMRHVRNLNAGKQVVIIVTGIAPVGINRHRKFLERLLKPVIKKKTSLSTR